MAFADKDLAEKLLLVARWKNQAKAISELADDVSSDLALITNRAWTGMTDAELEDLGITAARLTAYVQFLTQLSRLMSNQSVTTTNGRASVDGIRNV